jgi:hypothetical protein
VRLPAHTRLRRENSIDDTSIQGHHDNGNKEGLEILPKNTEGDKKKSQPVDQSTGTDMVERPAKQPDKYPREKITLEKYPGGNLVIKIIESSTQKK